MAYVQAGARRIRELDQCIIFGLGIVVGCSKCLLVIPSLLPFGFNGFEIVFFQCL